MKKRWMILGAGLALYALAAIVGGPSVRTSDEAAAGDGSREPTPAAATVPPRRLETAAEQVTLDYAKGEMIIRARLTAPPGDPPSRVWVWAFFVNPDEEVGGSRSDEAIELPVDFKGLDTLTVDARGPFHWSTRSDIPKGPRVFARVFVGAGSAEVAVQRASERDRNVGTMIPATLR